MKSFRLLNFKPSKKYCTFVQDCTAIYVITIIFIFVLLSTFTYAPQGNLRSKLEVLEEQSSESPQPSNQGNETFNETNKAQTIEEPSSGNHDNYNQNSTTNSTLEWMKSQIDEINKGETIYNQNDFPYLTDDDLVIVVQVHNRLNYLKYLIASLSQAKHIDEVLLIFSHDFYDDEINSLIRNITFCKVMQVFFPYSIQMHPDTFPGPDPKDCPRNIGIKRAKEIGCNNADYPDKFGHYREPDYPQIKHHWWWKMHHVFGNLTVTVNFQGLVVFLEEDHYVAPDVIEVAKLTAQECKKTARCAFLGLGNFEKFKNASPDEVVLSNLVSNLGLSFDRQTYLEVVMGCVKDFCSYDDYNWDWSITYVANKCLNEVKLSALPKFPRVFHLGECGVHTHSANCDASAVVSNVKKRIQSVPLFPESVKITKFLQKNFRFRENGGWGDQRDRDLCLDMSVLR